MIERYNDLTLAVIGLLTLGPATLDEIEAKLNSDNPHPHARNEFAQALSALLGDERAVLLSGDRYALIARPWVGS